MFNVDISTVEKKDAFMASLAHIRQRLAPPGRQLVGNHKLMMRLFNKVRGGGTGPAGPVLVEPLLIEE